MGYFIIVLIDQALVSLASYIVILNIVTELGDGDAVTLLQVISIGMLSYPLINGILGFRIIERKDDRIQIYKSDAQWSAITFGFVGLAMGGLFGVGALFFGGLTLYLVNILSHISRTIALSKRNGRALLGSSVGLVVTVGILTYLTGSDYGAAALLMPIICGRFVQLVLNYVLTTVAFEWNAKQATTFQDMPRFLAAMVQYLRTNSLFWLFSAVAPAAATVELRIIEMCLAPIRQLAASLQNYLIPRAAHTAKVMLFSVVAALFLAPASIVLLLLFDLATGRVAVLATVLAGAAACLLLSNAMVVIMRIKGMHNMIWQAIIAALCVILPLITLNAWNNLQSATALLLLEVLILLFLVVRMTIFGKLHRE